MPTPPPPTRASIKIEKTIAFRGGTKVWSNRYFLDGLLSPTDAEFSDIRTTLVNAEKGMFGSDIGFVEAVGYHPGSEVPVWSLALSGAGTMDLSGTQDSAPEVAALVRFSTTQRTVKNHPIYLFKYYHGVAVVPGSPQIISTRQRGQIEYTAQLGVDGFAVAGNGTVKFCGPYGAVAQSRVLETYVTHRDFRK